MHRIGFYILGLALMCHSCHVGRAVTHFKANITDHKIFPYTEIATSTNPFRFSAAPDSSDFNIRLSSGEEKELDALLRETTTVSFLVVHKDRILFERYYQGHAADDISNIFSVSKSITSLLVGIALDEGLIADVDDPVTQYLTELKGADPNFKKLTIRHLLNMRSGLKFKEAYSNPFAHVARLYYGRNQMGQIKRLKFESEPGTFYRYQSISTVILGMVVERVTGMELGSYLEQKVWQPMGMEYRATWSVDDQKHRSGKAYCCLNTTARDLAKIGRLYLQNGNWNGQQIVAADWVQKSKIADLENDCYQYQWYVPSGIGRQEGQELVYPDSLSAAQAATELGYPHFYVDRKTANAEEWHIHFCTDDFYAVGILGQYLYIDPETETIFVRLGEKRDFSYGGVFRQLIQQIKDRQ